MSAGSMSPWRRQPIRSNQVRAGATSGMSVGGGSVATDQPSNQRPELAGSGAVLRRSLDEARLIRCAAW